MKEPALILVVENGPEAGRRFACVPGVHAIGKSDSCAIQLSDPHVSRRHGQIEARTQSCLYQDLGSTNRSLLCRGDHETWLDAASSKVELNDGDVLVLGETRLRLEIGRTAEPRVSPPPETVVYARPLNQLEETFRHSLTEIDRLRAIYQLERRIYLEYDPERMLESILEAVPETLPAATHVVIALLDEEGKGIARKLGKIRGESGFTDQSIQISTSIIRRVLEERESLLWRDVPQHFERRRVFAPPG